MANFRVKTFGKLEVMLMNWKNNQPYAAEIPKEKMEFGWQILDRLKEGISNHQHYCSMEWAATGRDCAVAHWWGAGRSQGTVMFASESFRHEPGDL